MFSHCSPAARTRVRAGCGLLLQLPRLALPAGGTLSGTSIFLFLTLLTARCLFPLFFSWDATPFVNLDETFYWFSSFTLAMTTYFRKVLLGGWDSKPPALFVFSRLLNVCSLRPAVYAIVQYSVSLMGVLFSIVFEWKTNYMLSDKLWGTFTRGLSCSRVSGQV